VHFLRKSYSSQNEDYLKRSDIMNVFWNAGIQESAVAHWTQSQLNDEI
jgi:hypothetical protein